MSWRHANSQSERACICHVRRARWRSVYRGRPSLKLRSFAQDSGVRLIDRPDTQAVREALMSALPIQRDVTEALRRRAEFGLAECLAAVAR
jgi:hypothetical protein